MKDAVKRPLVLPRHIGASEMAATHCFRNDPLPTGHTESGRRTIRYCTHIRTEPPPHRSVTGYGSFLAF